MNNITAIITIIGFIISYFLLIKSFKQELAKQKIDIYLNELTDIPYQILQLLDFVVSNSKNQEELVGDLRKFSNKILAYGTDEAVRVSAKMFSISYRSSKNPKEKKNNEDIMVIYVLLFCQLKYDLTGIKISPEQYYISKLTDYKPENNRKIKDANNSLVKALNIDSFFLI